MPEVLDWQRGNPRLVLERAVKDLAAGKLVVFPTDTGYHLAASALHPGALAALGSLGQPSNAILAVRDLAQARRWAPWMSNAALRMGRRVWPGAVVITLEQETDGVNDSSIAGASAIRLRVPRHDAPLATLDVLTGPLVMSPLGTTPDWQTDWLGAGGEQVSLVIRDDLAGEMLTPTIVRVRGQDWTVAQEGSVTKEMLQAMMPTTVLFVCTGNTCRSPMAEGLCKALLAKRVGCQVNDLPQHGFIVLSAGLAAMMGFEATPEAMEAVREFGADLAGHRSQPLTVELLARADYLFTMTQNHLRALLPFCAAGEPGTGAMPRLLASDGQDVADPIGAEAEVYRDCAQQILRYLHECLPEIKPM